MGRNWRRWTVPHSRWIDRSIRGRYTQDGDLLTSPTPSSEPWAAGISYTASTRIRAWNTTLSTTSRERTVSATARCCAADGFSTPDSVWWAVTRWISTPTDYGPRQTAGPRCE